MNIINWFKNFLSKDQSDFNSRLERQIDIAFVMISEEIYDEIHIENIPLDDIIKKISNEILQKIGNLNLLLPTNNDNKDNDILYNDIKTFLNDKIKSEIYKRFIEGGNK